MPSVSASPPPPTQTPGLSGLSRNTHTKQHRRHEELQWALLSLAGKHDKLRAAIADALTRNGVDGDEELREKFKALLQ